MTCTSHVEVAHRDFSNDQYPPENRSCAASSGQTLFIFKPSFDVPSRSGHLVHSLQILAVNRSSLCEPTPRGAFHGEIDPVWSGFRLWNAGDREMFRKLLSAAIVAGLLSLAIGAEAQARCCRTVHRARCCKPVATCCAPVARLHHCCR